jgi:hypothetical protein
MTARPHEAHLAPTSDFALGSNHFIAKRVTHAEINVAPHALHAISQQLKSDGHSRPFHC